MSMEIKNLRRVLLTLSAAALVTASLVIYSSRIGCACMDKLEIAEMDARDVARQFSYDEAVKLLGKDVYVHSPVIDFARPHYYIAEPGTVGRVVNIEGTLNTTNIDAGMTYRIIVQVPLKLDSRDTTEAGTSLLHNRMKISDYDKETFAMYFSDKR